MRDDLPHAMRETARRLEPDVVRLAAGGVSRGTRMRRVERAVQVLGSAVAVAVVFAGVVLFGPHRATGAGGGGGANQPVVSGVGSTPEPGNGLPGTPSATDNGTGNGNGINTATATAPTAITSSSTGAPQISEDDLISTLKSLLDGTGVTGGSFVAHGSGYEPGLTSVSSPILVDARLSARKDVGFIGIAISGPGSSVAQPGAPQVLQDGSVVYVRQAPGSSDGRHADRIDLTVTLVRADGSSLAAVETNSLTEKSAAAPGALLLLTQDQVITMLDSPAWDPVMAAAALTSTPSPTDDLETALPPDSPSSPNLR